MYNKKTLDHANNRWRQKKTFKFFFYNVINGFLKQKTFSHTLLWNFTIKPIREHAKYVRAFPQLGFFVIVRKKKMNISQPFFLLLSRGFIFEFCYFEKDVSTSSWQHSKRGKIDFALKYQQILTKMGMQAAFLYLLQSACLGFADLGLKLMTSNYH